MENNININNEDKIWHVSLADGEATMLFLQATNTVATATAIHNTSPVCSAALGRTLIATAMLGARLKSESSSVTVTVAGGGPIGKITAVSHFNTVKGDIRFPNVILPARLDGKLDVAAAVGSNGLITVVKDIGMKNPYIGQTEIVSGEIAEDFALYFLKSEQQPSLVSLGVLVSGNHILSAGGVLIEALPGCSSKTIESLEIRSMLMADISKEILNNSVESCINEWFRGLNPQVLKVEPLKYHCDCSKIKMEKALIALGKKELEDILNDDQEGIEMVCHFCHKAHEFSDSEISDIINRI